MVSGWEKAEEVLDNYNADNGDKEKLCVFCNAKRYDSKCGIIHFGDCPITIIRMKYLQKPKGFL